MLIVDIKINENTIAVLKARRKNDVYVYQTLNDEPVPCKYDVSYEARDKEPVKFELEHDYKDMAEVLIIKALSKAKEIMRT